MRQWDVGYLMLCVAVLLTLAVPASAYNTYGSKWPASAVPLGYRINPAGAPGAWAGAVQAAASTWGQQPEVGFSFSYQGTTGASGPVYDSVHSVSYRAGGNPGNWLAVCYFWSSGGSLTHFDILFNGRFTFNTNGTGYDIETVALHEFGHAFGLAHSDVGSAVMYPSVGAGVLKRTPTLDDLQGAASLYPPSNITYPGTPVPSGPASGAVIPGNPSFSWSATTDTDSYQLWVETTGGTLALNQSGLTSSSFSPSAALPRETTYNWWVRGHNAAAPGAWSAQMSFTISDTQPGAPSLTAPQGDISDSTPTLSWSAATNATSYELQVTRTSDGTVVLSQTGLTVTTHTLVSALTLGATYQWYVRGLNGSAVGEWSSAVFTVLDPSDVGVPTGLTPTGLTTTLTPTFTWTAAPNATTYQLWVEMSGNSNPLVNVTGITGASYTPASALPMGATGRFYVRGSNATETASWSNPIDFSTPTLSSPSVISPLAAIADSTPTFSWSAASLADSYEIYIYYQSSGVVVHNVTGLTGTSFTPSSPMPVGTSYTWLVRAYSGSTAGPWAGSPFSITDPNALGTASPIAPLSAVNTATPTFSWSAAANATSYEIYIYYQSSGVVVHNIKGLTGTSFTPSSPMSVGTAYTWLVRPWGPGGVGSWAGSPFSITDPNALGTVSPIGPLSAVNTATPTFSWSAAANATSYEIYIYYQSSGVVVHNIKGLTGTSFTPSSPMSVGTAYIWLVRPWGPGGVGSWAGSPFSITDPNALGTVSVIGPLSAVNTATPTFSWSAAANATSYEIWIDIASNGALVHNVKGLTGTSFTPPSPMPVGVSYRWYVRPWGVSGAGPWAGSAFSITDPNALGTCSVIGPTGQVSSLTPTFSWTAAANATSYEIYIYYQSSGVVVHNIKGLTGISFTPPSPMPVGTAYTWLVRPWGAGGAGSWVGAPFSTPSLGSPTPTSPEGNIEDTTPTFSWSAASLADSYEIYVEIPSSGAVVYNVQGLTGTSYTPTTGMSYGAYRFWVRAFAGSQPGPWGGPKSFVVGPPGAPGPTTVTAPTGTLSQATVTISWTAASNATHYHVWVNILDGAFYYQNTTVSATSLVVPIQFLDDNYRVWVRPYNGPTGGGWSPGQTFTVAAGGAPQTAGAEASLDAPSLLGPTGPKTLPVTFAWSEVTGAATYELQVDQVGGAAKVLHQSGIEQTTHTVSEGLVVGVAYRWWVRAISGQTVGSWSSVGEFVISAEGLFEDWEAGSERWTADGLWHARETSPAAGAHGGLSAIWYRRSDAEHYDNGKTHRGRLTSDSFIVPQDKPTLSFWSWEQTEGSRGDFDRRQVELSSDDGKTWTTVFQSSDNSTVWHLVSVSLAAHAGQQVRLRFVFDTGDSQYNQYGGWGLDDIVVDSGLGVPASSSPVGVTVEDTPTFSWSAVANATSYELRVLDESTDETVIEATGSTTTHVPSTPLLAGKSYAWWVRAVGVVDGRKVFSGWSEQSTFSLPPGGLGVPSVTSPGGSTSSADGSVALTWSVVSGAATYEVKVHIKDGQVNVASASDLTTTSYTASGLKHDVRYVWWVRAIPSSGLPGPWSAGAEFTLTQ